MLRERRRCVECPEDVTDTNATATHRCEECNQQLCDFHVAAHRRSRATKGHALTELSAVPALAATCPAHQRKLEIFCGTCKTAICVACTFTTHPAPDHQYELLDDVCCDQARKRLAGAVAQSERAANAHANRALDAEVAIKCVLEHVADLKRDICAQFRALRSLLDARQTELLDEVDAMTKAEVEHFSTIGQAERTAHTVLMSTVGIAQQLIDEKTAAHTLVQLEPPICSRLVALARAVPSTPVPSPSAAFFIIEDDVERTIKNAGKLQP